LTTHFLKKQQASEMENTTKETPINQKSQDTTGTKKKSKLTVSLAYSGLIYLPVYVAKELKLFGDNLDVELILAGGDENAALQVLHSMDQRAVNVPGRGNSVFESDLAICDPFSISDLISDETKADSYGNPEDALIIGCLIDKPPVWVYRSTLIQNNVAGSENIPNPKGRVKMLDDIEFKRIKKIYCYPSPNTGFLFGIDLASRALQKEKKTINIEELNFNPTHCQVDVENELILTSNILKVAYDNYDSVVNENTHIRRVIYTYATGSPDDELNNFLFTGILANKISYQQKRDEIKLFLEGLKKAINIIKEISGLEYSSADKDVIRTFIKGKANNYDHIPANIKADDAEMSKIADWVLYFAQDCEFYSSDLSFTPSLYDKTFYKRKKIFEKQVELSYYKYVDLKLVNEINKVDFGFIKKTGLFAKSGVLKFYRTKVGKYVEFLEKYFSEVYSYAAILFLLGVTLILLNKYNLADIIIYWVGWIGVMISLICFMVVRSFYTTYKKEKKIKIFPKLLLTIISTIYISAIGGKLLSNFFTSKNHEVIQKSEITPPQKDSGNKTNNVDTSKHN
jgi:hypothetical protein